MENYTQEVTVVGGGSWGTALADLIAKKGCPVKLWVREEELCADINSKKENTLFLPGLKLSKNLTATVVLEEALKGASVILSVVPSHFIGSVFKGAAEFIDPRATVASASKGIEEATGRTASILLKDVLPEALRERVTVISGPTFAKEVVQGKPACVVAASASGEAASLVQKIFSTPAFRVYTNTDVIGVELGGALKNVIALAAGASDGLGLGYNARAALITRGLVEMTRLGVAMGAKAETFAGLSGMGDLVLTCTGDLSRNRTVGMAIGGGKTLEEVLSDMKMVAEGVKTSLAVRELGRKHGVDMPIVEVVCKVLYEGESPKEAVMELMDRELGSE